MRDDDFAGWVRERGGVWRKVCEGPTVDECRRLLRMYATAQDSLVILARGETPYLMGKKK